MARRDSNLYSQEDDLKQDYPVFRTESSLTPTDRPEPRVQKLGRMRQSAAAPRRTAAAAAAQPSSARRRPSTSRGRTPAVYAGKSFGELLRMIGDSLRALKEKRCELGPGDLCEIGVAMFAKASRGLETLQACQAALRLPIKYSGREESRYHKLMFRCVKRLFEHSVRAEYDATVRKLTLMPLIIKQLRKLLRTPETAPPAHVTHLLGAMRNLSNKEENQRLLVRSDAIPALTELLMKGALERLGGGAASADTRVRLLKTITTILRNLAVVKSHSQDFVQHGAVAVLGSLLEREGGSEDVAFGVCRILGKLSFFQSCRAQLSRDPRHLRALYKVLAQHNSIALGTRALLALGNLTVSNDENRVTLLHDLSEGKRCILLRCFDAAVSHDRYLSRQTKKLEEEQQKKQQQRQPKDVKEGAASESPADGADDAAAREETEEHAKLCAEVENFLTKIIRLIANISINPRLGSALCADARIEHLVALLESKDPEQNEELVLNIISAITNLSFYEAEGAVLVANSDRILGRLMPLLFSTNPEMLHESLRVLGNFSRSREFRALMGSTRVDEALTVLLDHKNPDVIFATAGVLLNVSTDPEARQVLYNNGCEGLGRAVECLYRFGERVPAIAGITCKILINLSKSQAPRSASPPAPAPPAPPPDSPASGSQASAPVDLREVWLPGEARAQVESWCVQWMEMYGDDKAASGGGEGGKAAEGKVNRKVDPEIRDLRKLVRHVHKVLAQD